MTASQPSQAAAKRTGARRQAREGALQLLFFMEASGQDYKSAAEAFFRHFESDVEGRAYAEAAASGVEASQGKLDLLIRDAAEHWRMERMARVDRNILRLGAWELLFATEVPRAVILDEAVELAKLYGTEESSAFVNGILNRIANILGRLDQAEPAKADVAGTARD
jgi:transcription antitermination protein NusB